MEGDLEFQYVKSPQGWGVGPVGQGNLGPLLQLFNFRETQNHFSPKPGEYVIVQGALYLFPQICTELKPADILSHYHLLLEHLPVKEFIVDVENCSTVYEFDSELLHLVNLESSKPFDPALKKYFEELAKVNLDSLSKDSWEFVTPDTTD